jgi:hypothetical protein
MSIAGMIDLAEPVEADKIPSDTGQTGHCGPLRYSDSAGSSTRMTKGSAINALTMMITLPEVQASCPAPPPSIRNQPAPRTTGGTSRVR